MKITSIIPTLGLAGVTAFSAAAQDDPKPQRLQLQIVPRAAGGALLARPLALPRLQLDLTEEQKNKISEIRKEQLQATREINQNKELAAQDRRDQVADLRAEYQQKIDGVYTAEQKAKLAKFKEDRAKRMGELRKNRGQAGGARRRGLGGINQQLGLTEKQQAKVKELNAERSKAIQKITEDYEKKFTALLTDEQKKKQAELRIRPRPNIRILPAPGRVQPRKIQPKLFKLQPRQVKPLKRDKIS